MTFSSLRAASALARLNKKASFTENVIRILKGTPRVVQKGFTESGRAAEELLGGGTLGKAVGFGIKAAPTAALTYGGAQLVAPTVVPFLNRKVDQFQNYLASTNPVYDPNLQGYM